METYKSIFSSATVWGIIISVLSKIFVIAFGVEIEESFSTEVADMLAMYVPLLIGLVGDAIAFRGRYNATKPLRRVTRKGRKKAEQ